MAPQEPGTKDSSTTPKKVWVCKIVSSENSPGGYRLKAGKQPIHVSVNALGEYVNGEGTFSDRQPSFVVDSNDSSLCSSTKESVDEEVVCPTSKVNGVAKTTTTSTLYFGKTEVSSSSSISARTPTSEELSACGTPPVEPPAEVICPPAGADRHSFASVASLFSHGHMKAKKHSKFKNVVSLDAKDCDTPEQLLVATASVSFTEATCVTPQQLIRGPIANATWKKVVDPAGPDDYSVTATAVAGAEFAPSAHALRAVLGPTTMTFTGTLNPQLDSSSPECDLATLGLVMPEVTFSQASCSAAGSYTLSVADGYDPALVTFTVNGVSGVLAGIYPVGATGSVAVTAQAVAPNGFEFGWSNPPAFAFNVPTDEDCTAASSPQLPTLALPEEELPAVSSGGLELPTLALPDESSSLARTGGSEVSAALWLVPMSMILLGAAAIFARRRMDAVS